MDAVAIADKLMSDSRPKNMDQGDVYARAKKLLFRFLDNTQRQMYTDLAQFIVTAKSGNHWLLVSACNSNIFSYQQADKTLYRAYCNCPAGMSVPVELVPDMLCAQKLAIENAEGEFYMSCDAAGTVNDLSCKHATVNGKRFEIIEPTALMIGYWYCCPTQAIREKWGLYDFQSTIPRVPGFG